MRPKVRFLSDELIEKIYRESLVILAEIGVEINNPVLLKMMADSGLKTDFASHRVRIDEDAVNNALASAPGSFRLYDVLGNETHDFSGSKVHFTPGSAALNILDAAGNIHKPVTRDYIAYAKVVSQLKHIAAQSTAFIPADVADKISDSYRLYLSLLYCEKPVVTGAFTIEAFEVMKDLQLAVRGSRDALREKPLTIFSCCPTSPLKWSDVTSQNLVDCARYGIPVEFISMPLTGFVAPVTITGAIIQHTAETLSGLVISQLVRPGTPVLYGGSPAAFDVRYETTPMGAVETMMIDCGYSEVGKHLGLPTQAYIALSDAKILDAQAGLETGFGACLATLSGINSISGPGMLYFENCMSLEKLALDNEIAGMCLRMADGVTPRDDFPSLPLMQELMQDEHLLISDHTRKHLRQEHFFPGPVIDRANRSRWIDEGSRTLGKRSADEVQRLVQNYTPSRLPDTAKQDLRERFAAEAVKYGSTLPEE